MKLTQEQLYICEDHDNNLLINAFAGTGKTTTLIHYALLNPNKKILYLCFNKGIQLFAETVFPLNVKCMTTHSLAFRAVGCKYIHKITPVLNSIQVIEALGLGKSNNPEMTAALIAKTLDNFVVSKDLFINNSHIPYEDLSFLGLMKNKNNEDRISGYLIKKAEELWFIMKSETDLRVGMLHDGYLKLFQLMDYKINYDIVMVDEAQDITPATASIIERQSIQKIIVGDQHQSIYQFRGSINMMKSMQNFNFKEYKLTNSFRFGEEIANYANIILSLKGETERIKGMGNSVIRGINNSQHKKTIISRYNASVVSSAFDVIQKNSVPIYFAGGFKSYNIAQLLDLYNIYSGRFNEIKSPILKGFKNIHEVQVACEISGNNSLMAQCIIVGKHDKKIPMLLSSIKRNEVNSEAEAQLIFTNVHKAKGKEYSCVQVMNDFKFAPINPRSGIEIEMYNNRHVKDFISSYPPENNVVDISFEGLIEEEFNNAYVAITRAKNELCLEGKYFGHYLNIKDLLNKDLINVNVMKNSKQPKTIITENAKVFLMKSRMENNVIKNTIEEEVRAVRKI